MEPFYYRPVEKSDRAPLAKQRPGRAERIIREHKPMKKKPFNVTLIVSPDYTHSLALAVFADEPG
jgi:hypothetical protein